jgi:prepilin-type N-terminal cleavage/methylation domain-containing protein
LEAVTIVYLYLISIILILIMIMRKTSRAIVGFTIVELLVAIVIIGILATVTIISYNGITQKAITAAMQSDLSNAVKQLKLFQVQNGAYPETVDCSIPDSNVNLCLKASGENEYSYTYNNSISPQTFSLVETNGSTYYKITNNSQPVIANNSDYGLVGHWKFDESNGITVADSTGNSNNGVTTGTNGIMGNFENTIDGFSLNCGGSPTTSYINGAVGQGIKLWSAGGDGLACMYKSLGGDRATGYTIWFYGKGYVGGIYWNGTAPSNMTQVDTGCSAGTSDGSIYDDCNGGNPYNEWTLFKIVATANISSGSLYLYDGPGASIEANSSSYDFITDTPGFVAGKSGNAISLDGVDDRINIGNSNKFNLSQFSLSYWYRIPESPSTNYETLVNIPGVSHTYFDASNNLWASTPGRNMGVHSPTINTWYHIVLTNDGSNYRAYLDGVLDTAWSCSPGSWTGSDFYIGGAGELNGDIDDLRVYDRVLSAEEAKAIYDSAS